MTDALRGAGRPETRRPRRRSARRGRAGTGTPDRIDDVILGCTNQAGEDNRNVARMAALLAGLPGVGQGIAVVGENVSPAGR